MPIVNMKIGGVTEPMGYEFGKPILSWQVEGGAGKQKDAAIKVYTDDAVAPVWECCGDLNWEGTVLALDTLLPRSGKAPFTVESGCYDYTYTPTEDYRALYSMDSRLAALADDEEAKQILLQETPALFGILMENNREFTTQTFHELSTAFFLGLNPPKIQALMARLSALRYRPDQH